MPTVQLTLGVITLASGVVTSPLASESPSPLELWWGDWVHPKYFVYLAECNKSQGMLGNGLTMNTFRLLKLGSYVHSTMKMTVVLQTMKKSKRIAKFFKYK